MVTLQTCHTTHASNATNCRNMSYSLIPVAAMAYVRTREIVSCSWLFQCLCLLRFCKGYKKDCANYLGWRCLAAFTFQFVWIEISELYLTSLHDIFPRSYQKYQSAGLTKECLGLLAGRLRALLNGLLSAKICFRHLQRLTRSLITQGRCLDQNYQVAIRA